MKSLRSKQPVYSQKNPGRFKCNSVQLKDPVQVFCRLRPLLQSSTELSYIRIISETTLSIHPPESAVNFRLNNSKEIRTTFTKIFPPDVTQQEVFNSVSLPLVESLLFGGNSLLFTYGISGSGKTYTMIGNQNESGILPRSLYVLFNSIKNYQADRFIFKPNKLNGFDIQCEKEALIDKQKEIKTEIMSSRNGKMRIFKTDSDSESISSTLQLSEDSLTLQVDPGNIYSVFITYIEIYNNCVFDLLEEDDIRLKPLQNKIIREDWNKNMYVHGVMEVEVKSVEEALAIFQRGQRRRRVAHTALNAESSRSHSVFTIRLVKAPLDHSSEQVIQDNKRRVLTISQLSLVDLAGSERTNRTKNTGQRLREAGNINNSLMCLRTCIEILRENQNQSMNKMVPYRDSKLTHLFKQYFDGEGQVRMIVCVNPRAENYDETIQMMKFAEMTQEVQITRPTVNKMDPSLNFVKRQANYEIRKGTFEKLKREKVESTKFDLNSSLVYSLGAPFPELEVTEPHDDHVIMNLVHFLERRINRRSQLHSDLEQKQIDFRKSLLGIDEEITSLKVENASLKAYHSQQEKKITALQIHIDKAEGQVDSLMQKLTDANKQIRDLTQELQEKKLALNQGFIEEERVKQKYKNKIQSEIEKLNREMEMRIRQEQELFKGKMREKDTKIETARRILVEENVQSPSSGYKTNSTLLTTPIVSGGLSVDSKPPKPTKREESEPRTPRKSAMNKQEDKIMVANPRYRRSRSADRWIEHRSGILAPVATVFQPLISKRKSISKLTSPKKITDGVTRYCLVDQQQDSDGQLKTMLFKGDIIPTSGGGAQVHFIDVECLKQRSPLETRKRNGVSTSRSNSESDIKKPRV